MINYRSILPKGLLSRTMMILVLPLLLLQLVVALIFIDMHVNQSTRQIISASVPVLRNAIMVVEEAETPAQARAALSRISRYSGFNFVYDEKAPPIAGIRPRLFNIVGRSVYDMLSEQLKRPMVFTVYYQGGELSEVLIQTELGPLAVYAPRERFIANKPIILIGWTAFATIILMALAIPFLRNQIKPIIQLAQAAKAFGKGHSIPFRVRGAREVRQAGAAFVDMRRRIEQHIDQRTLMLSGVSHDLRTPLTRMRLAAAMVEDNDLRKELENDAESMEHMLIEFLEFIRGRGGEEAEETDIALLVEQLAARARRQGTEISVFSRIGTSGDSTITVRKQAIRRAIINLIDNAARYGSKIFVSLDLTQRRLIISIEDDGPGIEKEQRDAALRPFRKLDDARNQDVGGGGVGLGLSIALDIVRGHGGDLRLEVSEKLGGLCAKIELPR